jgi:hypothetical protein
MNAISRLSTAAAASLLLGGYAAADDCLDVSNDTAQAVRADKAAVLEIVEGRVTAHPNCACDIVKAAIKATEAEPELVAAIVEAVAMTAPEQMRLASQCAIAVAPDATSEVQAVLIRLDPSSGEAAPSAKGDDPKVPLPPESLPAWNPLDFPTSPGVEIGPTPGTWNPGGPIPIPPVPPIITPPVVEPPVGTPTDPGLGNGSGSPGSGLGGQPGAV